MPGRENSYDGENGAGISGRAFPAIVSVTARSRVPAAIAGVEAHHVVRVGLRKIRQHCSVRKVHQKLAKFRCGCSAIVTAYQHGIRQRVDPVAVSRATGKRVGGPDGARARGAPVGIDGDDAHTRDRHIVVPIHRVEARLFGAAGYGNLRHYGVGVWPQQVDAGHEIGRGRVANIDTVMYRIVVQFVHGGRPRHSYGWRARKTFCGSVDRSDWSVLLPGSAGKGATADSAAKGWQKAFDDWAAKKLVEPVTERWDLSSSIADGLGSLQGQYHNLMLGQPVHFASEAVGLPPLAGDLLGDIASEHRLPGDTVIKDLKRIGQVAGIGVGCSIGNPHMVHVCVNSLAKDLAMDAISHETGKLFTSQTASAKPSPITDAPSNTPIQDLRRIDRNKRPPEQSNPTVRI